MREVAKSLARLVATILVLPNLASYFIKARMFGADCAIEGSTHLLSLIPGMAGDYLRKAFLMRVLASCDPSAVIRFGTLLSKPGARIDANVYVGPGCHLGLVHLERDVLLASGVHVPSGAQTHGIDDVTRPIREQAGVRKLVRIGEGTWVGSAAVVLADVGRHCVIGAGSVVTQPLPDFVVAAGVPARIIKHRRDVVAAG
jgi:acetyltransferase-like isoleucine patch superfamily enzyme